MSTHLEPSKDKSTMSENKLRTAVISANRELRGTLKEMLKDFPGLISVVADVPSPTGQLDGDAVELLHEKSAELVVADFDSDPAAALRLIRVLSEAQPSRAFIGTGPELPPRLLLEAMRSGVSEYLPAPVAARDVAEAVRRVGRKLGRGTASSDVHGRLLAVTGAKGGTGASTAAANIAAHTAALTGQQVLLLDLDLEYGSTSVLTGVASRYSILDLVENLHRLDESLLASLVVEHESGLHVLPAPSSIEDIAKVKPEHLRTVLRLLLQHYPLTVADVARPLSRVGTTALEQADEVFLVLNPDLTSLRNARRILDHLHEARPGEDGAAVRILLNRAYEDAEIGRADIASALDRSVSFDLRRDDEAVTHSVNVGHPIVLNGSRSGYSQDVKALGLQVARSLDPEVRPPSSDGLFGRLRSRLSR